jgi:hypothetical protein
MRVLTWISAAALSLGATSFANAQVTGTVKLDGKAPEMGVIDMSGDKECADQHSDPVSEETIVASDKGELANVIVYVKTEDPSALGGQVPKSPAIIDQKGCMYVPHVLAVMTGQEMKVKNDDPFLHNVHSFAQVNPAFNFAQPNKDEGKKVDSPKAAEVFKVKCDVHPWMLAWVHVFEHPFFAVSGADGKFKMEQKLPAGEYTFVAWHEKLGEQEQTAKVGDDGKAEVNFTFKAEGARANPVDAVEVKLASYEKAGDEKKCDGQSCCTAASKAKAVAKAD